MTLGSMSHEKPIPHVSPWSSVLVPGQRDRQAKNPCEPKTAKPPRVSIINLQIARAYLIVGDPAVATRTCQFVLEEIVKLKKGETERRWKVAIKDQALNSIRQLPLMEPRAENRLRAVKKGKVSTNIYLRRIHNFALGMKWLPVPVIPVKQWRPFTTRKPRHHNR